MRPFPLILTITAGFAIPSIAANFHISSVSGGKGVTFGACPDSAYNCDCFVRDVGGRGTVHLLDDSPNALRTAPYFQVKGLCGVPVLDFQRTGKAGMWFFENEMGSIKGMCTGRREKDAVWCSTNRSTWTDELVCTATTGSICEEEVNIREEL